MNVLRSIYYQSCFSLVDINNGEDKEANEKIDLADDTIEIREVHHSNDGRDAFALLLRRQKLPDRFDVN